MAGISAGIQAQNTWYSRLIRYINSHWDEQQRVTITGTLTSGDNSIVRFLAARATDYVRAHVQTAGTGGETYNATTFVSDVRIDCRANRQQDYVVVRSTASDYYVWLVPEFLFADTYIRFNGVAGQESDHMAFVSFAYGTAFVNASTGNLEVNP